MNLLNEFKYQIYEKEFINKYNKSIKNQLKILANSICYNEISERYINNSINNYEFGYVYRNIIDNDKIVSFVLWSLRKQLHSSLNEIYIHIICGKGLGKLMFNDIEEYAYDNKINIITLAAINEPIKNHYIKEYGFKVRGYDKILHKNILYKNINYNNNFIKLNKTKKNNKFIELK